MMEAKVDVTWTATIVEAVNYFPLLDLVANTGNLNSTNVTITAQFSTAAIVGPTLYSISRGGRHVLTWYVNIPAGGTQEIASVNLNAMPVI
jgi:hypothetical protein